MFAPLGHTLRERLDARSIAGGLLFTALLAWLFDQSFGSAIEALASATLVGGSGLVAEAYGLREEVQGLGFGVWTLAGGLALTVLDPTPYVGELFVVAGAWLLLDNVQTLRHEGVAAPERTPADGEDVYRQYLAGRIRERLRERPHTRRELREAFSETPEAVDEALTVLRDHGLVEREGSEFRVLDPPSRGPARRALARLARPLTVERRTDESSDDASRNGRHDRSNGDPETGLTDHRRDRETVAEDRRR